MSGEGELTSELTIIDKPNRVKEAFTKIKGAVGARFLRKNPQDSAGTVLQDLAGLKNATPVEIIDKKPTLSPLPSGPLGYFESANVPGQRVPDESFLEYQHDEGEKKVAAQRYESDEFLREHEMKFIEKQLEDHSAVMIVGSMGRGKSTIMKELYPYLSRKRSVLSVNAHRFDTGPSMKAQSAITEVAKLKEFTENPQDSMQHSDLPIVLVDSADSLHSRSSKIPYGSSRYLHIQTLLDDPMSLRNYVTTTYKNEIEDSLNWEWIREKRGIEPGESPGLTESEVIDREIGKVISIATTEQAKAEYITLLDEGLKSGKFKVVLVDHGWEEKSQDASLLTKKYGEVFGTAYRYELPESYEPNRARIFLERNSGITDPILQRQILEATNGSHQLLKYVVTRKVIAQLQAMENPEERQEFLAEVIEKGKL